MTRSTSNDRPPAVSKGTSAAQATGAKPDPGERYNADALARGHYAHPVPRAFPAAAHDGGVRSTAVLGQGSGNDPSAADGGPITVEGCLTSVNGYFSLATRSGLLRLKGDHDSLFGHNGQQVRVTGTVTSGKKKAPQTLKIFRDQETV